MARRKRSPLPISGEAFAMAKTSNTQYAYASRSKWVRQDGDGCEFCDHAERTNDPDGCCLGHAPRTVKP